MIKLYTVEEALDLQTGDVYPADHYLLRVQYYLNNLRETFAGKMIFVCKQQHPVMLGKPLIGGLPLPHSPQARCL